MRIFFRCWLLSVALVLAAQTPSKKAVSMLSPADFAGSYLVPLDAEHFHYRARPIDNPISRLQQKIDRGQAELKSQGETVFLQSVLQHLGVAVSSQVLVFSKTSLQTRLISPENARAIYFNDEVYVAWVPGSELLEVSAVDAQKGGVFFELDQKEGFVPRFRQNEQCLQCHHSAKSMGVPGHLIRSVQVDADGFPQAQLGEARSHDSTRWQERFGGWLVSGVDESVVHLGNRTTTGDVAIPQGRYLRNTSDALALLVLNHQVDFHNLMARVKFEVQEALLYDQHLKEALGEKRDLMDSSRRRIDRAVEALLYAAVFHQEAPLPKLKNSSLEFIRDFESKGRVDKAGRSFRQFDLKTRLFRYPLSFLIESEAFRALPLQARDRFRVRLHQILSGPDNVTGWTPKLKSEVKEMVNELYPWLR
jgi:hypothetical protein